MTFQIEPRAVPFINTFRKSFGHHMGRHVFQQS